MNAYLAVVLVENIHTDELCHYVGEGGEPSGDVKLLGKEHVGHLGTSHGRGRGRRHKERKHYSRERSTAIDADD